MALTPSDVADLAKLARIELTPDELEHLAPQLEVIWMRSPAFPTWRPMTSSRCRMPAADQCLPRRRTSAIAAA